MNLRIEGKGQGWVKVGMGEKVEFKWLDVLKNHDYLYSILVRMAHTRSPVNSPPV